MPLSSALGPAAFAPVGLGFRNLVINGAMQFSQRTGTTGVSFGAGGGTHYYAADRFSTMDYTWSAGSNLTVKQVTPTSEGFSFPTGFNFASRISTGATALTLASGGQIFVKHSLEGYTLAPHYSSILTLSFWVRSSVTGVYSMWLANSGTTGASSRSILLEYTVNSANTWEKKTININMASATSAGTWNVTNGGGMYIQWMLGAHADRSGTLNTNSWGEFSSYIFKTSSSVNWTSNANATFYLTGVQLEVGTEATSFEHRPFTVEQALCERYYEKSYELGTPVGSNDGTGSVSGSQSHAAYTTSWLGFMHNFRVQKRATPGITVWDLVGNVNKTHRWGLGVLNSNNQAGFIGNIGTTGILIYSNGGDNASGLAGHFAADAEL